MLTTVDAEYLHRLVVLSEKVASSDFYTIEENRQWNEETDEDTWDFIAELNELNAWAKEVKVNPALIRHKIIGQDAYTNSGNWYHSSVGC